MCCDSQELSAHLARGLDCLIVFMMLTSGLLMRVETPISNADDIWLVDFDILRVRIWLSTIRGQLRSKIVLMFESPYYSFLSNLYWYFLSQSVFETFYIKFFYLHFFSISYRLQDIWIQCFQGLTLTCDLWKSSWVKKMYTIWKPMYNFLFDFYGHHLSISYRFRDIRL